MKHLSRSTFISCLAAAALNAPVLAQAQPIVQVAPHNGSTSTVAPTPAPALVPHQPDGKATTALPQQQPSAAAQQPAAPKGAIALDLGAARDLFTHMAAPGWNPTVTEHVAQHDGVLTFRGQSLGESQLAAAPLPVVTNVLQEKDALREFGCTDVLIKQFQRGTRNVNVIAYRFASPEGAYGAYTNLREGATNALVRGDRSSEDDHSISFQRGHYFVRIVTSAEDDDEAKGVMTKFADMLSSQLPTHSSLPSLMTRLPAVDRVTGSERLFMGSMTARRHTSIPYIGQLDIEQSHGSAYADYQFSPPMSERMKLILVEYLDFRTAQDVFNRYVATLGDVHRVVTSSPNSALFKISDKFLYCQTSGKDIVVISGARKRISPLMLARQLGSL